MEQFVIRRLPSGTKAALRIRAKAHHRSLEAEARAILTEALEQDTWTINDLLAMEESADIEFEPQRSGFTGRTADL